MYLYDKKKTNLKRIQYYSSQNLKKVANMWDAIEEHSYNLTPKNSDSAVVSQSDSLTC